MSDSPTRETAKKEDKPQVTPVTEQLPEGSTFTTAYLRGASPPPNKPKPNDVLQLQRLIGNQATQRYLAPLQSISTNRKVIQLTRFIEDDIVITLPTSLPTLDNLVELIASNAAFRRRMMARGDGGEHIREVLRDHSNLPAIYRQLQTIYQAGGNPSPLELHVRFQIEPIAGTSEERVDQIQFQTPNLTTEDFGDDEGSEIETDAQDAPEFGLETSDSRRVYVEEALRTIIPQWEHLGVIDRWRMLLQMVNRRLRDIGVPEMIAQPVGTPVGTGAEFDAATWSVAFSETRFQNGATAAQINRLVSDFYHEARHAETRFLALRYVYQNTSIAIWEHINNLLNTYPDSVRSAARRSPPLSAAERAEARRYYDEYFSNIGITAAVYDEWDAANQALADARRSGDATAIAQAETRQRAAEAAYRALAGETDAYDVGDEVLDQLTDANPPTP